MQCAEIVTHEVQPEDEMSFVRWGRARHYRLDFDFSAPAAPEADLSLIEGPIDYWSDHTVAPITRPLPDLSGALVYTHGGGASEEIRAAEAPITVLSGVDGLLPVRWLGYEQVLDADGGTWTSGDSSNVRSMGVGDPWLYESVTSSGAVWRYGWRVGGRSLVGYYGEQGVSVAGWNVSLGVGRVEDTGDIWQFSADTSAPCEAQFRQAARGWRHVYVGNAWASVSTGGRSSGVGLVLTADVDAVAVAHTQYAGDGMQAAATSQENESGPVATFNTFFDSGVQGQLGYRCPLVGNSGPTGPLQWGSIWQRAINAGHPSIPGTSGLPSRTEDVDVLIVAPGAVSRLSPATPVGWTHYTSASVDDLDRNLLDLRGSAMSAWVGMLPDGDGDGDREAVASGGGYPATMGAWVGAV